MNANDDAKEGPTVLSLIAKVGIGLKGQGGSLWERRRTEMGQ